MLPAARERIERELPDEALVLDVGGWAVPYWRADWVLDLMPYETRGSYGYDGDRSKERVTPDTWVARDLCAREPWPFADGQFDFAICSHTLEDVRDPIFACAELLRVARAGYIEVPSRLWEQSYGVQGPWVGFGHHHWLIDVDDAVKHLRFVFKPHVIHAPGPDHFPAGFVDTLDEEEKVAQLWWDASGFTFEEHVFYEPQDLHDWLRAPVQARGFTGSRRRRWRR